MDPIRRSTIGVAGGYGYRASSYFTNILINRFQKTKHVKPTIVTVINTVAPQVESRFIHGKSDEKLFFQSLSDTVETLVDANCEFIVLPCNSLHFLFRDICNDLGVEGLSPIQALQGVLFPEAKKKNGILASSQLLRKIIVNEWLNHKIGLVAEPSKANQAIIDNLIINIIANGARPNHTDIIADIIKKMNNNVDRWIVACSELSMLTPSIRRAYPHIDIVDTLDFLIDKAYMKINH